MAYAIRYFALEGQESGPVVEFVEALPMREVHGKKIAGVSHATVLARQLKDPEFRYHYEQRKLVHEVAVAVRAMRKQAGLTQAQLASRVGVSQPMIAKIEKGIEQRAPRWEMLGRVCVALNKQLRLSFRDPTEQDGHLVEVDGKPASELEVRASE